MRKGTVGKNSILAIVLLALAGQTKKFSLAHPAILHEAFENYGRRLLSNVTDMNETEVVKAVDEENITEKINFVPPASPGPINWPEPIVTTNQETCYSTLRGLTNNFLSQQETFTHVVRNSGKDYNDYGRYDDCVEIDGFNFYMVTILHRFPIPMSTGLCLPK
jgi:hypothetical protein